MSDSLRDKESHGQRARRRRRGVLVCGVGLMVVVPAAALDNARPSQLGWHMYASVVDLPQIGVVFSDGSREERAIEDIASGIRPEVDYFEPVARFICGTEPNASSVEMTRARPAAEVVFQCAGF